MTATERLRELLDGRGVEWKGTGDGSTLVPAQNSTPVAWEVSTWPSGKDMGDCLWIQNRHPLTPEQAVEATLGRGTCTVEHWGGGIFYLSCGHEAAGYAAKPRYCPNCGRKVDG